MNCRRAERLMPLFVGRDLDEDASRAVATHVSRCTPCGRLEEGLRRSRNWLRGAAPPVLDDLDYLALRRGVWRRIGSATPASGRMTPGRLILAGGTLLCLLFAAILILRSFPGEIEPPHTAVATMPTAAIPLPVFEASSGAAPEKEAQRPGSFVHPARSRRAPVPLPQAAPPEAFVKIEFQTAHPNVRIIWLVQTQEVS